MTQNNADFGVVGLGVMGQNIARNVHSRGYAVSVYNRTYSKTEAFVDKYGDETFTGYQGIETFVQSLASPKKILLMVKAGAAIDAVVASLKPFLEKGDIIIDGGNSLYEDTTRRERALKAEGLHFFGMGISGGEEGALHGPSLMPGGEGTVWKSLQPILESIAAKDFLGNPCVTHIGPEGAGHYVKMVHNGIEYGIMQMLAEAYELLKTSGRTMDEITKTFQTWAKNSPLQGFLMEISAEIVAKKDDLGDGYLLDQVKDTAGQKGTGRWTAVEGFTLGQNIGTISQAVHARVASSQYELRQKVSQVVLKNQSSSAISDANLLHTLEAGMLTAYAQGLGLIFAASEEHGWNINLTEVCRIWQGGCIIRAQMLKQLGEIVAKNPTTALLETPAIGGRIGQLLPAWRETVAAGVHMGVPLWCLGGALTHIEAMAQGRTSANFIQGLRDNFGAHTFERLDREGSFHADWNA